MLGQDFPAAEMEILVVHDGSTDRTPRIARKFEPRVRIIRKENGGQASAFNAGMPEARGEIVAFLDGDDWWAREKLKRVVEALDADPAVGIVGHGIKSGSVSCRLQACSGVEYDVLADYSDYRTFDIAIHLARAPGDGVSGMSHDSIESLGVST